MGWKHVVCFLIVGVAALTAPGCGDVVLKSRALDTPVVVDGKYDDWDGRMTTVQGGSMSIGACNDTENLYVIIVVGDEEKQRSIMMSGLTLWFDPAGGTDGQFGIHYPLGLRDPERFIERPAFRDRDRDGDFGGEGGEGVGDRDNDRDMDRGERPQRPGSPREMRAEFRKEALAEAELIGAGGAERITRAPGNLPGVQVAAGSERGTMVLEYRIPLTAPVDAPWGVGAIPGATVGVGVVTPEIDLSTLREEMAERRGDRGGTVPGGERPGGGGMDGGMGMGGGPPGGVGWEAPKPIDLWGKLILASAP